MADPVRLSSADYVLIHAVGRSVCNVLLDPEWDRLTAEMMVAAMPKITPGHPMMEGFARVAADIMAAGSDTRARVAAKSEARDVLRRFHEQRMAEAWEFLQGKGKANG